MRITSKVHASRMPAAAAWKIKEIARSALQRPDSFWAIRGSNCMQFERPIAWRYDKEAFEAPSRGIRGNGGARRQQQDG
ncbi:hypothetical protein [Bradyrhizobium elkanii]|uniref:hypothetical protein n=1 Tax=Bradyrhizobium elkanii TaxID=29448 RepID=UPI0035148A02